MRVSKTIRVAASRSKALAMVARGEAILVLLVRVEGILGSQTQYVAFGVPSPSDRGQDARDTQGRDALATRPTSPSRP
ncbi:MAG: hypothetical protein A2Y77_07990 [Planctomycetes bacterium RBG_13_62_9]|nr:MAG: hypothetical protein A2Y77_07990 [Planctomycetes bacterium RBG_13_62_9]